jgi:hypothetical protein
VNFTAAEDAGEQERPLPPVRLNQDSEQILKTPTVRRLQEPHTDWLKAGGVEPDR